MQALERHLSSLHAILVDESASTLLNPVSVIADINDFCARINEEEIGRLCVNSQSITDHTNTRY
jgi:hypothetical protein